MTNCKVYQQYMTELYEVNEKLKFIAKDNKKL